MKKKFDFKRVTAFLLCLLLWATFLPHSASAAKLEEVDRCTLELSYTVEEHAPMADVEFRLYRVAVFTDAVTFHRIAPFDGYAVTASAWLDRAATLAGYVARDQVEPTVSGVTDEEGNVRFEDLEKGLYLIVGDTKTVGDYVYTPTSFLISLPYTTDGQNWEPDVETYVKFTRRYIGGGGGEPGPTTVSYHVLKVWDDDSNEARPESVTVDLLRNGVVYDTVTLSAANNWRHDWTGLDAEANWQIAERTVAGYTTSVSQNGVTFVITNTLRNPPPTIIPGETPPPSETPNPSDPPEEPGEDEDWEDWDPPLADWEDPYEEEEEDWEDFGPPLADLPQTGQLWWPVPVMAMGGILLTFLGIVRRRRWSGEDEE